MTPQERIEQFIQHALTRPRMYVSCAEELQGLLHGAMHSWVLLQAPHERFSWLLERAIRVEGERVHAVCSAATGTPPNKSVISIAEMWRWIEGQPQAMAETAKSWQRIWNHLRNPIDQLGSLAPS